MENLWFSVRCIFKHTELNKSKKNNIFEERITVWQAGTFEEAMAKAEEEAVEYARNLNCKYTGLSQVFQILKSEIKSGVEVFSLMRESDQPTKNYLDYYFDTGLEKQKKISEK